MLRQSDADTDTVEARFREMVVSEVASARKISVKVAQMAVPSTEKLVADVVKVFGAEIDIIDNIFKNLVRKNVRSRIGKPAPQKKPQISGLRPFPDPLPLTEDQREAADLLTQAIKARDRRR